MSPASPPPGPAPDAAIPRRHDLMTTLTTMRLRVQLLLRVAHRHDAPEWQRVATGLAAIDADISTLVRQIDHHDGA